MSLTPKTPDPEYPLVGRLAPSPTGAQHIGNARTYLLAWLSIRARGGRLILVTDAKGAAAAEGQPMATLTLPTMPSTVAPLVYAVPVQLIAYHTAVIMGTDVDQPRNLAKSVTVE